MDDLTQEAREELIKKMRLDLIEKGVIKTKRSDMRERCRAKGLIVLDNCETCGKKLPDHLRQWCSGECMHPTHNARERN